MEPLIPKLWINWCVYTKGGCTYITVAEPEPGWHQAISDATYLASTSKGKVEGKDTLVSNMVALNCRSTILRRSIYQRHMGVIGIPVYLHNVQLHKYKHPAVHLHISIIVYYKKHICTDHVFHHISLILHVDLLRISSAQKDHILSHGWLTAFLYHQASMLIEMCQSITCGSTVAQATFEGSHWSSGNDDMKKRTKWKPFEKDWILFGG